ncbi:MAG: trypsin-like peptidase domain-containing protein [Planctomycetota bacterium]
MPVDAILVCRRCIQLTSVAIFVAAAWINFLGVRSCIAEDNTVAPALSEEFDAEKFQAKIFEAIDKVMPAVVAVRDRGGTFSAVIINEEGLILSAGHAVEPNRRYKLELSDGRTVPAIGLGSNAKVDCAMLQITQKGKWPFAEMGQSSTLVPDQPCLSISHPGQFDGQRGPVVRLGYVIDPLTSYGMIQSTAKMEPGDSGGPLVDLEGRIIGIHSNIRRTVDRNYDLPIDAFRKFWDDLKIKKRFDEDGWPALPTLGFQIQQTESEDAVEVTKVVKQGIAERAGLRVGDVITLVAKRRVRDNPDVARVLKELAVANSNQFDIAFRRDGKDKRLSFQLETDEDMAMPEITDLAQQYSEIEAKLDDTVVQIKSTINGKLSVVRGTRIKTAGGGNIISKSSRVHDSPKVLFEGNTIRATVVKRDPENDLVLLQANLPVAKEKWQSIDLSFLPGDMEEKPGRLLISPDDEGQGQVSVWGSKYFNVSRTSFSGGYLGVVIGTEDSKVVLRQVQRRLAAENAGLNQGDVILKINDKTIGKESDLRQILRNAAPLDTIKVQIARDGNELMKSVILGRRPETSGHVADRLPGGKSVRRDGFQLAISHDADLKPEECGGPVFDAEGGFLGVNMARNSRTRCYVVPKTIIQRFVGQ